MNLELDDVSICDDRYSYNVDATDEEKTYIYHCNDLIEKKLEK